jgi:DNA polymerase V
MKVPDIPASSGGACGSGRCGCSSGTAEASDDGCSGAESFALQVLGDSMAPEFEDGDIIVIEPEGALHDGSYVLAWSDEEWIFRQLRGGPGAWTLAALQPGHPERAIASLEAVRGVVIQKSKPGRRRAAKFYT